VPKRYSLRPSETTAHTKLSMQRGVVHFDKLQANDHTRLPPKE